MLKYIGKRIVLSIITVWLLATIVFVLIRLLPGDPFSDGQITEETAQNMMRYYGLDKPIPVQYVNFIKNLLQGDLGYSLRYNSREVTSIIGEAAPYSFSLGIRALIFAIVAGLALGIVAALNHNGPLDYLSIIIAVIGVSIPSFVVGYIIQLAFAVKLGWFPVARWGGFKYTVLPSFALGLSTLATLARLMRAKMLDVNSQDYIKTAKAKGISPFQIVWKHQIRNSILPIITVLGPMVARVLTGAFVIEQIYAIPGLGRHYVISIQNLDYTLTLGLTVFFGAFLVLMNLLVDIAYGFVDPRIRVEK